jgi:hypothetical protein
MLASYLKPEPVRLRKQRSASVLHTTLTGFELISEEMIVTTQQQDFRTGNRTSEQPFVDRRHSTYIRSGREQERQGLEATARTQVELSSGRRLSDAEWATARTNLVEFARLVRAWGQRTRGDLPKSPEIPTNETLPEAA